MEETERHREAFETYYGLGMARSLPAAAKEFGVSVRTIKDWSSKFNWKGKVAHRDMLLEPKVDKKTSSTVLEVKAAIRDDVERALKLMRQSLHHVSDKIADYLQNPQEKPYPLEVSNVREFRELVSTYESLVKIYNDTLGITTDTMIMAELVKDFDKLDIEARIEFFIRGRKDTTSGIS